MNGSFFPSQILWWWKKIATGFMNFCIKRCKRERTYRKISTWTASFCLMNALAGRLCPSRKQRPLQEGNGSTEGTQAKWTGRARGSVDRSASIGTDRQRDGPSSGGSLRIVQLISVAHKCSSSVLVSSLQRPSTKEVSITRNVHSSPSTSNKHRTNYCATRE